MSAEPKVRRGAMLLAKKGSVGAVERDESEATVWDRQFDIRVGIRGVEMGMSPAEGRAFAALIIEAVRRATRPVLARTSRSRLDDDMPADELELSTRTVNVIQRMDLRTVGDIRRTADLKFLRTDNCGRKSLNELREMTGPYNEASQPSERKSTGYCGLSGAAS